MFNFALIYDFCSVLASSAEELPKEGNGIFSGTFGDSLWTIVWFVTLLIVLKKFAWKHILAGLQAREDKIAKEISDAEKIKKDAEITLAEYRSKLEHAEIEAKANAKIHMDKAQAQSRAMIENAQQEGKIIKERAQVEVNIAKAQAREELLTEAGSIVLGLGSRILKRSITDQDNERLISEAIEKFKLQSQNG